MADLTNISHVTSIATFINKKRERKTRGATMYTKMKKAHENNVHYPVTVDIAVDMAYGEHAEDFMGYIPLQGRGKMSILIDN